MSLDAAAGLSGGNCAAVGAVLDGCFDAGTLDACAEPLAMFEMCRESMLFEKVLAVRFEMMILDDVKSVVFDGEERICVSSQCVEDRMSSQDDDDERSQAVASRLLVDRDFLKGEKDGIDEERIYIVMLNARTQANLTLYNPHYTIRYAMLPFPDQKIRSISSLTPVSFIVSVRGNPCRPMGTACSRTFPMGTAREKGKSCDLPWRDASSCIRIATRLWPLLCSFAASQS